MKVLCSSFDVIVSLQELLMCFWQKVVQILYFHILLSYGGVPDLSPAPWAMAHKVSSAKNAQQREQKPHRGHTGGIFQRTFLMPFSLTCAPDLHSSGDPITVLLTEHSVKNVQFICSQDRKGICLQDLEGILCVKEEHAGTIYQNVFLLSQNIFFSLKWGFLWKSPNFVAQNGTLSVIPWINTPCLSGGLQRQPV